jgi:hypothetical protein
MKIFQANELESCNRARRSGYLKYMQANPEYFRQLWGIEPTRFNIIDVFNALKRDFMVCAPDVPDGEKNPTSLGREFDW